MSTPTETTSSTSAAVSPPPAVTIENTPGGLGKAGLAIARIVIGLLWFSQLLWKLPPTFGCPSDFAFSTRGNFTSGLCDWIGREAAYAGNLHVFNLDLHLVGAPNFSIDLSPISGAYGSFLNGFVLPNFSWMAWLIFAMELFITISILFGVLGRLGALVGTLQALNLTIGLLPVPGEWEWTYILLIVANLMLLATAANRYFGVDALLHRRFAARAAEGRRLARVLKWLT
jgi:uncharacterized membrane protein YphA (DoxX/SURF4 family)